MVLCGPVELSAPWRVASGEESCSAGRGPHDLARLRARRSLRLPNDPTDTQNPLASFVPVQTWLTISILLQDRGLLRHDGFVSSALLKPHGCHARIHVII